VNLELDQLTPDQVRARPALPHPAWALAFVALAAYDFWTAFAWLRLIGENGATPDLVFRIQADIVWGMLLALALVSGWLAGSRRADVLAVRFVLRKPGIRPTRWLGALAIALLYGLTYLPIIFLGQEGLAGRALAAVPLDIAMAVIMLDLTRWRREARRIIRAVRGPEPVSEDFRRAVQLLPEIADLRPEDLLPERRWFYNLPGLLGVVQTALGIVALVQVLLGWSGEPLLWQGAPWELWTFGGWGLGIGLWGFWHESRQMTRPGRYVQIALRAVLRERRDFPFYLWDWWGYTVILLALIGALVLIGPLGEQQMRLATGALAAGYGLGVTPLYRAYSRPWRLAEEILREVRER
jgi:hypothetical protein